MQTQDVFKLANTYVYEKLTTMFFGKKSDQMDKFKAAFDSDEVS
jgi:hypothetical protein